MLINNFGCYAVSRYKSFVLLFIFSIPIDKKIYWTCNEVINIPDENAELTKSHQCLKYATVLTSLCSSLPKYSIFFYFFVFTLFFLDFRRTLWHFPLKFSNFNSPEPNLACPLKKKTIEPCKSYIFPMKVQHSQKVTNV